MTHTDKPFLSMDRITQLISDFFVSQVTTDEIREIKFAFMYDLENPVSVAETPTPAASTTEMEQS